MYQYPKSDNFHFYTTKEIKNEIYAMYQYPKSDNFHFYKETSALKLQIQQCINILNRITFISTVPSQNPHK